MDALSHALIKLYDEPLTPKDPVAFVRQHFKKNAENAAVDTDEVNEYKNVDDPDSLELVRKLQEELMKAKQEILSLRMTLETMNQTV